MKTFKTRDAATKARARALGMKGAAGGWIYQPRPEHLLLDVSHSARGGSVPNEWRGRHVVQSWASLDTRFGNKLAQTESGRWIVVDGPELYEAAKAKSSDAYARMLEAMATGDEAEAAHQRARHEGYKARVFAAYDLIASRA